MFIEIQKDLMSLLFLNIIFFMFLKQVRWKEYINKAFFYLLGFNMLLVWLNLSLKLLEGHDSMLATVLLYGGSAVYFSLPPVLAVFWFYYVDLTIFNNFKRLWHISLVPSIITIVNYIFVGISFSNGMMFSINSQNEIVYGDFYWLMLLLPFLIFVITNAHLIRFRKVIRKKDIFPLLAYSFPMLLTVPLFMINHELQLIWNGISISNLVLYMFIQSRITSTDFLTGLFNRRAYESIINDIGTSVNKNTSVFGMTIDVNDFKLINDTWGHRIGDEVLVAISKILIKSVRSKDYTFRIGGDEFAVVLLSDNNKVIDTISKRILEELETFNQASAYPFDISLSIGKGRFDANEYTSLIGFFEHLDFMMYDDKKNFKRSIIKG